MKAINKLLTIEIEYTDISELRGILTEIHTQVKKGKTMNRLVDGTSIYSYRKSHLTFPEYSEEKINGVWCMVYQSKMNKKQK